MAENSEVSAMRVGLPWSDSGALHVPSPGATDVRKIEDGSDPLGEDSRISDPSNWPDGERTDQRHFVFVHGINASLVFVFDVDCEGGWGVNTRYALDPHWYLPGFGFTSRASTNLAWSTAVEQPLFTPFRYYLNPTSLDRNLEWDCKTNLFNPKKKIYGNYGEMP